MARCGICGRVDCERCKYPDHLIERKYNKHDGGQPTSNHRPDPAVTNPKPHVWPKFVKGTKDPREREPVT